MKKLFLLIPALFFAAIFTVTAQTTQPTAVLQYFDNPSQVTVTDASGNNVSGVYYGMDLGPGYTIKTGNSTAEIQLDPNGSILKLAYNTNFTIQTLQGKSNQTVNAFSLLAGRLRAIAAHAPGAHDAYSIQTPTAVCGVRGTDFSLDVVPGKTDAVGVLNGVVNFVDTQTGKSLNVTAGNFANTFASVFQAVKMTNEQVNQLFSQMSFKKLNPTSVPGHAAETQPTQTETQTAPQPTSEQPASTPTEASKPRAEGPIMKFLSNNLGMQIGTITIDGTTYSKAVLQPHFSLGRLKLGLYLPVIYQSDLFNPTTWYRPAGNNEWNFGTGPGFSNTWQRLGDAGKDLMLKIQYVEWGKLRDPFFFKVGNLNDLTIGHGLLMYNYVNNEDFPAVRKIGFDLGIDFKSFGFQSVVDNLADPQVFGGRLYVRPLGKGFLKPAFGVSGVADINPSANLNATQTSQYGDPIFIAFGPDIDLPFIDSHNLSVVAFADLGGMMPYYRHAIAGAPAGLYTKALFDTSGGFKLHNYGFASGLLGNAFGLNWRLEYRYSDGVFQPAMFNSTYNRNRGQYVAEMASYVANPSSPAYQSSTMGIYGQAGMTIGKHIDFVAGYFWPWSSAAGFKIGDNDYLHLKLDLKSGFIPGFGIGASLAYDRTDFLPTILRGSSSGLSLFDANTTVKAEVDYPIASTLDLALIYTTAIVHNADGTVKQDPNNPSLPDVAGSFSIETRIHF